MRICLNRVESIQENDKQNTSGATASAPTGDTGTLIEIRKHSQHVNEKQLWEQFHTDGEEGGLYFGVPPVKHLPLMNGGTRWMKAGSSQKVRKPARLKVNSTRTLWKRRQRGHFVVSVVPDILSGGTCCLRVLVCHSGHASSRRGRRG